MMHASPAALASAAKTTTEAADVLAFWREAGPGLWFAKDAASDQRFAERFLSLHDQAARGLRDGFMPNSTS